MAQEVVSGDFLLHAKVAIRAHCCCMQNLRIKHQRVLCCCADKHGHLLQASGHNAASSLQQELMKKDAWDRYTQDELRDDLLDFCRKDFEFESTEV